MAPQAALTGLIRRWQDALDQENMARTPLLLPFIPEVGENGGVRPLGHPASFHLVAPALKTGAEPVPGFRLEARAGGGGSGEVWRAIGPDGFPVALKFIPLEEEEGTLAFQSPGTSECRSLGLMRDIRHANLLPVFGAWRHHGMLIVGMELADRTLMDRCDEAIGQGFPGIPFPELIEYVEQAAQGIDFLNEPSPAFPGPEKAGILHCDVKPQNLLLVGGTVKVSDFGLARPLDETLTGIEGLTPAYAAPEFFQGRHSRHSDQYALALTYCRLRGGRLAFTGTQWEVILKHCLDAPDLTMLPAGEQPVVARALAKRPEERWPNCRAFVHELRARGGARSRRRSRLPVQPIFLPLPSIRGRARSRLRWTGAAGLATLMVVAASAILWKTLPGNGLVLQNTAARGAVAEARPMLDQGQQVQLEKVGIIHEATIMDGGAADTSHLTEAPFIVMSPLKTEIAKESAAEEIEKNDFEEKNTANTDVVERKREEEKPEQVPQTNPERQRQANTTTNAKPMPKAATINVLMPCANSELIVEGAVRGGQPNEWFGSRRVVHTPPLQVGQDYRIGAFWTDLLGSQQIRTRDIRVEPGRSYEVDLRLAAPIGREIQE